MASANPRVILISGGARGIGAAIAAHLAKSNHKIIAADRNIGVANAPPSKSVRLVKCDVSNERQIRDLAESIRACEGQLDGLVCNAGFMIRKPITELSLREWRSVLDSHLTSIFLLVRATQDLLRASRGSVVTIASTRAHMSEPHTESYAAAKGGILALTHALAISLSPDVRVNCISPGWINTGSATLREVDHVQHPAGRVGEVRDVAALATFLLGSDSNFCTGAEFIVDGGMTRKMIYAD